MIFPFDQVQKLFNEYNNKSEIGAENHLKTKH